MSAPTIIGEPCGCQVLEHPDIDADQYLCELPSAAKDALDRWMDSHVEAWRDGAVTALAHGGGVLTVQRHVGGLDHPEIHDDHIAQMVLTLNTERPPIPA